MTVLDASALLAYLTGEPGAEVVEEALKGGALCSAANWSEVNQKVLVAERDWPLAAALLATHDLNEGRADDQDRCRDSGSSMASR